jgi:hypothetical protein
MSCSLSHSSGHSSTLLLWSARSFTKPVQFCHMAQRSRLTPYPGAPLSETHFTCSPASFLWRSRHSFRHCACNYPALLPPDMHVSSPRRSSVSIILRTLFHAARYGYPAFLATGTCVFPSLPVFYVLHYLVYRSRRLVLPYGPPLYLSYLVIFCYLWFTIYTLL